MTLVRALGLYEFKDSNGHNTKTKPKMKSKIALGFIL